MYFLNTAYCTYPGTVDTMSNSREEVSGESFLTLRKCQEISARGHSRTRGTQVYTYPKTLAPDQGSGGRNSPAHIKSWWVMVGVGGMAEALSEARIQQNPAWSLEESHTPGHPAGCGGFFLLPTCHRPYDRESFFRNSFFESLFLGNKSLANC